MSEKDREKAEKSGGVLVSLLQCGDGDDGIQQLTTLQVTAERLQGISVRFHYDKNWLKATIFTMSLGAQCIAPANLTSELVDVSGETNEPFTVIHTPSNAGFIRPARSISPAVVRKSQNWRRSQVMLK